MCKHIPRIRARLLPPFAQIGLMTDMEISFRCPICHNRKTQIIKSNAFCFIQKETESVTK